MIRNLRDTPQKNPEQDWLKTNRAKFSRMLQGQRDLTTVGRLILSELAPVVTAQQGEFYVLDSSADDVPRLTLLAGYASQGQGALGKRIGLGQGLVGQCAVEKQKMLANIPPDYIRISSGRAEAPPKSTPGLPIILRGQAKGSWDLPTLGQFNPSNQA